MEPIPCRPNILWFEELNSTNAELRRLLEGVSQGIDNLSIVAANRQSAGRGQGDHSWFSSPGLNLTFSLLLRFAVPPFYGNPVSSSLKPSTAGSTSGASGEQCKELLPLAARDVILITCAVTLGIRDYLLGKGIEARIKWPNDIWVGDRKICGILIENILSGAYIKESIVGVGLNLNEVDWPKELPNPISLKELTGKDFDIHNELTLLVKGICRRVAMMQNPDGRSSLQGEFGKYMFRLP